MLLRSFEAWLRAGAVALATGAMARNMLRPNEVMETSLMQSSMLLGIVFAIAAVGCPSRPESTGARPARDAAPTPTDGPDHGAAGEPAIPETSPRPPRPGAPDLHPGTESEVLQPDPDVPLIPMTPGKRREQKDAPPSPTEVPPEMAPPEMR